MNKINNKSIVFNLSILAILSFGVFVIPNETKAEYGGYISSISVSDTAVRENNPKPEIIAINPSSSNTGIGNKTVTITGKGFVPSSVAKINGSNRQTTFIDSSHLLIQITGNDTYTFLKNGGFFIAVTNSAPGGGNSNAIFFKITTPGTAATTNTNNTQNNNYSDTSTNFIDAPIQPENTNSDFISGIASNAIFGSTGSIFPSGLTGWVFFAILVLLIVIMVRRIYGGHEKYHALPMKHD